MDGAAHRAEHRPVTSEAAADTASHVHDSFSFLKSRPRHDDKSLSHREEDDEPRDTGTFAEGVAVGESVEVVVLREIADVAGLPEVRLAETGVAAADHPR
jgi:hypothetical protein